MPIRRFFNVEEGHYKRFMLSTSMVVAVFIALVFAALIARNRQLIFEQILNEARAHFKNIAATRRWSASYGGVYVIKSPGMLSNPYLQNPDLEAKDGRTLTLKNPALMTREISELLMREGRFFYRITSLKPVNPANAPDDFERAALIRLEKGESEVYAEDELAGRPYFRYMAPLTIEESCIGCHGRHDYRVGDLRGGITVNIDLTDTKSRFRMNVLIIVVSGLVTAGLVMGLMYLFTVKLVVKLSEARLFIEKLAVTDDLTGLYNRRYIMGRLKEEFERARRSGQPMSVIMIDIDRFKDVNDQYGHLIGDEVLRDLAAIISGSIRIYDVTARFGGEEFLVISPGAAHEETMALAERLRASVEMDLRADVRTVTVSLGVATINDLDRVAEDVLRRSDQSLYAAKNAGRNKVCCVRP